MSWHGIVDGLDVSRTSMILTAVTFPFLWALVRLVMLGAGLRL